MHSLRFRPLFHLSILLISVLFYAHLRRITRIQAMLAEHSAPLREGAEDDAPSRMMAEHAEQLKKAIHAVRPHGSPAFLLLNRHALNVTLNFVCNLRLLFPDAATRLVAVVFDAHSERVLRGAFPRLQVVRWRLNALRHRFGAGDWRYQLFQYFRARLAAFLTHLTPSFWMVQADTIWSQDLFQLIDLDQGEYAEADLLFDSEGRDGIAGGYFFVRSSARSRAFFDRAAAFLLDHFATDNNVMARQCLMGEPNGTKCAQIPYSVISNWRHPADDAALFQFDGGDSAAAKFDKMRAEGLLFVDPETIREEESGRMRRTGEKEGGGRVKRNDEEERVKRKDEEEEGGREERKDGEGEKRVEQKDEEEEGKEGNVMRKDEEDGREKRKDEEEEERRMKRKDEDEEDGRVKRKDKEGGRMKRKDEESGRVKCLATDAEGRKSLRKRKSGRRKGNRLLGALHALFEWLHAACPALKHFLLTELFPYYAAHLFI